MGSRGRRTLAAVVSALIGLASCAPGAPALDARRRPIIGGRPAEADELYATVALIDREYGSQTCTGTLIASRVVLTAAHCLFLPEGPEVWADWVPALPEQLGVAVGLLDVTVVEERDLLDVERLVSHEGYLEGGGEWDEDGLGEDNDIGLIVLAEPVVGTAPAAILPLADLDQGLVAGAPLVISGYGVTDLTVQDFTAMLYIAETSFVRHNGHDLLAGEPGEPGACYGDSGGPAYLRLGEELFVVGVSSRGPPDTVADCGEGSVYTLSSPYIDWLVERSDGEYQAEEGLSPEELEALAERARRGGPLRGDASARERLLNGEGGLVFPAFGASGGGCDAAGPRAGSGLSALTRAVIGLGAFAPAGASEP